MSVRLFSTDDESSNLRRKSSGIPTPVVATQEERHNARELFNTDDVRENAITEEVPNRPPSSFAQRRQSRRSRRGRPSLVRAEPLVADSIFSAVRRSSAFEELKNSPFASTPRDLVDLEPVVEGTGQSTTAKFEDSKNPDDDKHSEQSMDDGNKTEKAKKRLNMLVKRLYYIKFMFAAEFGFINGVTYLLSSRFATMMSGNTLTFANQLIRLSPRHDEDAFGPVLFTFLLIMSYEVGSALFYFVWYESDGLIYDCISALRCFGGKREENTEVSMDSLQDELNDFKDKVVCWFSMAVLSAMGPLADYWKLTTGCSKMSLDDDCVFRGLHYLLPIALSTGIVAGGYLTVHPTGVTTNMITGHLGKVSKLITKFLSPSQVSTKDDWDALKLSGGIILFFFIGALVGFSTPKAELNFHHFHPVFTVHGLSLAILIKVFNTTYNNLVRGLVQSDNIAKNRGSVTIRS